LTRYMAEVGERRIQGESPRRRRINLRQYGSRQFEHARFSPTWVLSSQLQPVHFHA
jgi:hypothetical protein